MGGDLLAREMEYSPHPPVLITTESCWQQEDAVEDQVVRSHSMPGLPLVCACVCMCVFVWCVCLRSMCFRKVLFQVWKWENEK